MTSLQISQVLFLSKKVPDVRGRVRFHWQRVLPKTVRKWEAVQVAATKSECGDATSCVGRTDISTGHLRQKCWHTKWVEKKRHAFKCGKTKNRSILYSRYRAFCCQQLKLIPSYCKSTSLIKTTFSRNRTFSYLCATSNNLSVFCPEAHTYNVKHCTKLWA